MYLFCLFSLKILSNFLSWYLKFSIYPGMFLFILLRVCDTFLNEGLIFVQFTRMFRFYPFKYCFSTVNTFAYFLYSQQMYVLETLNLFSMSIICFFSVESPWDSSLRLTSWPLRVLTDQLASRWDQTQLPQLEPFCPWSPTDVDDWSEYPDQVKYKRLYWPLSPSFSLSSS